VLMRNRILSALDSGAPAFGTWVQTRSAEACEAAAATGFEFVVVDLQHGSFGLDAAGDLIGATLARGASPVVRVPVLDPVLIGQVLDAGAHGVLVPDLRSGEQARAAVRAAQYAPEGTRGACPTVRATAHGAIGWDEYRGWAATDVVVWGLVETVEAIEDVEAIATSGLHALVMGPFDLSMAMGLDGDVHHPDVVAAMQRVLDACRTHGVECVAVLFQTDPEEAARAAGEWRAKGCRIVTALSDRWCLTDSWGRALAGLQKSGSDSTDA
jgi:2-keto-3-deoxy-L-rhamnonate aldolase RhmA